MTIESNINRFRKNLDSEHDRFRSWEHCYKFFQKLQKKETHTKEDIDLASLHLGFYLASWGMYRASTFSFKKDYKIHTKVVKEILKEKYDRLNNIKADKYNDKNIDLLFKLIIEIIGIYKKEAKINNVTDTLVTKILLGTLGCAPAYDTIFKVGIRREKITYSKFDEKNFKNSFKRLVGWCNKNKSALENCQKDINKKRKMKYPIMKLVDMHFWVLGGGLDKKHNQQKNSF